ncbi:MAG: hypothetical protein HYV28_19570 [Ignavibacteriales bacterium]|nr:hypothetical protein [Ignavibacteriales bacterium]
MKTKSKQLIIASIALFILGVFALAFVQQNDDVDTAYMNAKKGTLWALNNLKVKKAKAENKLIEKDQLLAVVKVEKEINGIKLFARGFEGSTEVTITMYKTFESLLKEGYIDKSYLPKNEDD